MIKLHLRVKRLSIIIWSIALSFFMIVGMSETTFVVGEKGNDFAGIMDMLPSYMMAMYGMNTIDVTTIEGFYAVMVTFTIIGTSIYSLITLNSLFANEEIDKTFEYSLTKSFKRKQIATYKYITSTILSLILSVVLLVVTLLVNFILDLQITELIIKQSILIFISMLFMHGIVAIVLLVVKSFKNTVKINLAIFMLFYIIFVGYQLNNEGLNILYYLNPISLFSTETFINDLSIIIPVIIGLISYLIGFICIRYSLDKKEF